MTYLDYSEYDNYSYENWSEGLITVYDGDYVGFANLSGELVTELVYSEYREFSEGLAAVNKNGKWVYINRQGTVIIGNIE